MYVALPSNLCKAEVNGLMHPGIRAAQLMLVEEDIEEEGAKYNCNEDTCEGENEEASIDK